MRVYRGRAFDRLVTFTDAIVAVAMTVLVLSIVDIRGTAEELNVWQVINDNSSAIITFAFTFIVVAVMWNVHNRMFNSINGFDNTIFWLNLLWLIAIVFLPWPSALYGEGFGVASTDMTGSQGAGGAGLLYWGNLAVISLTASMITTYVLKHPHLIDTDSDDVFALKRRGQWRGYIFGVYFIIIGVLSLFIPAIASWLALGIIPLTILLERISIPNTKS